MSYKEEIPEQLWNAWMKPLDHPTEDKTEPEQNDKVRGLRDQEKKPRRENAPHGQAGAARHNAQGKGAPTVKIPRSAVPKRAARFWS